MIAASSILNYSMLWRDFKTGPQKATHTHTHRETAQQASHEKSARAQVLCPSQDLFVGKVSEGCNMLEYNKKQVCTICAACMLWQARGFTNLL